MGHCNQILLAEYCRWRTWLGTWRPWFEQLLRFSRTLCRLQAQIKELQANSLQWQLCPKVAQTQHRIIEWQDCYQGVQSSIRTHINRIPAHPPASQAQLICLFGDSCLLSLWSADSDSWQEAETSGWVWRFQSSKVWAGIGYLLNDVKCIFHDLNKVNLAVEYQISVVNCPKRILLWILRLSLHDVEF